MQRFLISCLCILYMVFVKAVGAGQDTCTESKCSDDHGLAIHFPLHLRHHCGDPGLECNGRQEKVLEQQVALVKFFVKSIDYKRGLIEITLTLPYSVVLLLLKEICIQSPASTAALATEFTALLLIRIVLRFPDLKSCTRMYDVLSVPFGTWVGGGDYLSSLQMSEPNCTECEAEGKRCRLKDNGIKSEVECIHLRKASKDLFHIYSAQFCRVSKAKQWNSWQRVQRWVHPFF
ncbi:rust resistance kinase Lr10-like [Prunus yedoensis var. nudiflora]|uniref:RING-type E3 ubiquitin transferase n=1 Tax=Prunus yedoensis var. nudiflora TaxID=2094558 RepID=A0A314ZN97_PRUYE|nr:rust resistance kinase Lr10-like [Prunus yedoensis var. nudiflora]